MWVARALPLAGVALAGAVAARWARRETDQGAPLSPEQCAARRRQVIGALAAGFGLGAILAAVTMVTGHGGPPPP